MSTFSRRVTALATAVSSVVLLAACTTPGGSGDSTASAPALPSSRPNPVTGGPSPAGATEAVVAAANAFLGTLNAEQRERARYDAADPAVRNWSNLPVGSGVARNGVALGDLTAEQRAAAFGVAEAMLSADGYAELRGIVAAGDVLNARSGGSSSFSSERNFLAFFGEPDPVRRFTVQFGGHHLAVTTTYDNGTVSPTPAFAGVDPRFFEVAGDRVEPLRDEADAVFALLGSLDSTTRDRARIAGTFDDVIVGAGDDGEFPAPEGVPVSDLTAEQRQRVVAVVRAWVGDTDERVAAVLLRRYEADLDQTRIAWAGSTDADAAGAYLRIDGPRLWIEFSNQDRTGNGDTVHYHSVYRDKQSDYAGG